MLASHVTCQCSMRIFAHPLFIERIQKRRSLVTRSSGNATRCQPSQHKPFGAHFSRIKWLLRVKHETGRKKKKKPKMLRSNRKARRKRKRFHWRNRIYPAVHPRCSRSIHSSHQRLFCVPHSFGERPAAANPFAAQQSSPFHCVTRWRPSADQKGPNLILFSGQVKSQQLDCLSSPLSAIHQSRNEAIETIVKWNSPTRIGVDPIKLNVQ